MNKDNYVLNATIDSSENHPITVAQNESKHNQGFKFTANNNITLNTTNATKHGTVSQLTRDGKSYEIKTQTVDGSEKWFLTEITTQ